MDILYILLDILLKPPQPLKGLFLRIGFFLPNQCPYPEIDNANFKYALWTYKLQLALKMRARCRISIVLL